MPVTESQKKASIEYAKRSLKRIPLDVQKEKYEEIKAAADAAGEKVNGYIKRAIDERMERDKDHGVGDNKPENTTVPSASASDMDDDDFIPEFMREDYDPPKKEPAPEPKPENTPKRSPTIDDDDYIQPFLLGEDE